MGTFGRPCSAKSEHRLSEKRSFFDSLRSHFCGLFTGRRWALCERGSGLLDLLVNDADDGEHDGCSRAADMHQIVVNAVMAARSAVSVVHIGDAVQQSIHARRRDDRADPLLELRLGHAAADHERDTLFVDIVREQVVRIDVIVVRIGNYRRRSRSGQRLRRKSARHNP